MSTTTLKISKKAANLIWTYSARAIMLKIDMEISGGRFDSKGVVKIEADAADIARLREQIAERLPVLDAALKAATTDEERKPLFGEHSAWSALLRQLPPQ
jgi:isochorismate hydrolase